MVPIAPSRTSRRCWRRAESSAERSGCIMITSANLEYTGDAAKNSWRHKPVSGLRAPLIIAEPGPMAGSQRSSAEVVVYRPPSGLPSALIYLAFHGDATRGLLDAAVGRVEMHHEVGLIGARHAFDPPFPDFLLEVVENDLGGGGAEQAADIVLGHTVADAGVIGLVHDMFDLADHLLVVETDHVAMDAARLPAVSPGRRAIVVPVPIPGLADAGADFGGGRQAGLDFRVIDGIASGQQGGDDGGGSAGDPNRNFHHGSAIVLDSSLCRDFWWARAAKPPMDIKPAIPRARPRVDPHSAGAIRAAARLLKPDWKKVWQEAARPRWAGKGSRARMVRQGMARDMPLE